jgi:hypothetical protein
MDTMRAMMNARAAAKAGARMRAFDWEQAARILAERRPAEAVAGLQSDLSWTGGTIWRDGKPVTDEYTYLASLWAVPVLVIGDEEIPCWRYADECGYDMDTKWPDMALAILEVEEVLR